MIKRIFIGLAFLFVALSVSAIPARPKQFKNIKLSDGTTVVAQLVGDEFGHYWLTKDGQALRKTKNGFVPMTSKNFGEKAQKRREAANRHRMKRQARKMNPQLMAVQKVGEVGNYVGDKKGLIILVEYNDDNKFQPENNLALYQRIANDEGFSEGEFVGSVHDYFLAQSEGLFNLKFDVVGPYTLKHERAYYGGNADTEEAEDLHPAEMVAEACQMADNEVDFKNYDWNGDGEVDQVFVLYAGAGEANGGDEDTVWPHEWTLASAKYFYDDGPGAIKLDGVTIDTYACSNELQPDYDYYSGEASGWKIDGIGTICHEFSHCLGYPDFYDTNYQNSGMGYWDLMDSGAYNGESFCPSGYTSYERWVAGWKEPIELTKDTEVTGMKALQDGGDTYIIYNEGNRNEYFLLENRQWMGWDEEIPGRGLLILHVDYDEDAWWNNKVNTTKNHERMTWIPADGKKASELYEGRRYYDFDDMATDPYPYKTNNKFTNTSKPAADVYNKDTDGSNKLNKSVLDITQNSDGTVAFRFLASAGSVTPSGEAIWQESWDDAAAGDAAEDIANASATYEGDGGKYCKIFEEELAGGTAPELLIPKKSREKNYLKATISLGGNSGELPLTFNCNKQIDVTTETAGVSITFGSVDEKTYSYTVSVPENTTTLVLVFSTTTDSNARIDDIMLSKPKGTSSIGKTTMKSAKNEDVYTLQGVKISSAGQNLKKGIYIVGGKKIVVK
ncbi:MAG: M6 family metalloprotease domain-containing protein [Prevotella sp.]|nr:M6 family metalloprotease domain-containing protein [Prevotella sp.]